MATARLAYAQRAVGDRKPIDKGCLAKAVEYRTRKRGDPYAANRLHRFLAQDVNLEPLLFELSVRTGHHMNGGKGAI